MDTGNIITIVLRLIHIFSGIAWVGGLWLFVLFVSPTVAALGPDGGKFVAHLVLQTRYIVYVAGAAGLTILAGWTLWIYRYGLPSLQTAPGVTFALGGVFGLIAGIIGGAIVAPTARQLATLGTEIARGGKPPTPEQGAQMKGMQARLKSASEWTAILATIAVLCMATARYL